MNYYKYRIKQNNLFSYTVEKAYLFKDGSTGTWEYVEWCLTYAGARWCIRKKKNQKEPKIVWEG